jgi:molybdopterin biosynthesis enzyme
VRIMTGAVMPDGADGPSAGAERSATQIRLAAGLPGNRRHRGEDLRGHPALPQGTLRPADLGLLAFCVAMLPVRRRLRVAVFFNR